MDLTIQILFDLKLILWNVGWNKQMIVSSWEVVECNGHDHSDYYQNGLLMDLTIQILCY